MYQGYLIGAIVGIMGLTWGHMNYQRANYAEAENRALKYSIEAANLDAQRQRVIQDKYREYVNGLGEGDGLSDYLRDGAGVLWSD